jgi:transposase-like protein
MELASYRQLQSPKIVDERVFAQVLNGISTRKYEIAVGKVPETFGISKSSVSRKFIEASARKLKELSNRDLGGDDIVAVFMDGKSFAENEMIIALGVTMEGRKTVLGMVESHTENHRVCREFLQGLKDRGLRDEHKLLFIIDGAKGLRKGIQEVFGQQALIQRCQWHKRENVVSYLPKKDQDYWRRRLQKAYERPTEEEAREVFSKIRSDLIEINESAVRSLDEGFEETLTLHKLGLFPLIGRSLKTSNIIESVNAQAEERCGRVDPWKNSNQKQRWLAAALIDIEPRLRRLSGYRHLPALRVAIIKELKLDIEKGGRKKAA